MKKLYWIMIPVYILVVIAVILLNGIFTGGSVSAANIIINACFLLIILLLIIRACMSLSRALAAAEELEEFVNVALAKVGRSGKSAWNSYREDSHVFRNSVLNAAFLKYQHRVNKSLGAAWRSGERVSIDSYINEQLFDEIGEAHFNGALPGVFTGLGILGTFMGLSFGMMSFSGNDIFTISDNVGPLLEGMKVAFHTSVYGMVFSLVFTFVYRGFQAYIYKVVADFATGFEECVAPNADNEADTMSVILMYQSQLVGILRNIEDILAGESEGQTRAIEAMLDNFNLRLSQNLASDFKTLGRALENTLSSQQSYSANLKNLSESTAILLESCQAMRDAVESSCERDEQVRQRLLGECDRLAGEIYTMRH